MQLQVNIHRKSFRSFEKHGQVAVLENVCFSVNSGEFLCIFGPSGCGKTTILRMLAGLEDVTKGEILIDDSKRTIASSYFF